MNGLQTHTPEASMPPQMPEHLDGAPEVDENGTKIFLNKKNGAQSSESKWGIHLVGVDDAGDPFEWSFDKNSEAEARAWIAAAEELARSGKNGLDIHLEMKGK